ncbi:DUF4394 domain-containing protein [Streptomyces sp. A3M-1-3]|uniref:DUF4394 domain-containing protein n=1 Tax=Streptomyces sp. A3M-1-3 TaxID=2962044 RepID=UPI0020B6F40E|nr:DUF4394 domain-containing protein [Streptomyces sp. A3M-1-3]MCP3822234.1 DUF4394 domain-containing protein [Streptomyces sp. A3M-1-3]
MRTHMSVAIASAAVAAALVVPAIAVADTPTAVTEHTTAATDKDKDKDKRKKKLSVIGLTKDQKLVKFDVKKPSKLWSLGKVSGLSGDDTKLVGIDFRVQNGKLYGVGDGGGIYTLNTDNAQATKVSELTVDLEGTWFGVDFNPAANRLRVISDTGQNLRHNIDDPAAPLGTTEDGDLTNLMPPGTALGVTGAAYTNNDLNPATATTLFDIDTTNDRVSVQSPANAGNLAPTGSLGVDAGLNAGFDIYYNSKAGKNLGFAALKTNGSYGFYKVSLLTGRATSLGAFPKDWQVTDVALPLNQR